MSTDALSSLAPTALLGFVLLLAFVKIGVVLAVLRSGIGAGIPPRAVTALLALILSMVVTAPLAERAHRAMLAAGESAPARLQAGLGPLREFLQRHTPPRELRAVQDLARRTAVPPGPGEPAPQLGDTPTVPTLTAAFFLSELRVAFQVGFFLLLPFLAIDLLCGTLLAGLSLGGLSARAIALPFKLLLFVVCDGWTLLARGLLLGYA